MKSEFKLDKLIKLIIEVFMYSIFMLVITMIFTDRKIGIMELLKSFLPIIYSNYWFVTNYIVLYVLSPFINRLIKNLNQDEYIKLIIILFIILSVIPTFMGTNFVYSNLIWFVFLYLLAGYLRIYYKFHLKKQSYLIIAVVMYLLIFILSELILAVSQYIPRLSDNTRFFSDLNKVPAVICSACLFLYFKESKLKYNKYINKIASATFAIYLLHDNYLFKKYLWNSVLMNSNYYNSKFMILHYIISVILIFVFGIIIEEIRNFVMKETIEKVVERVTDKIECRDNQKRKNREESI